MTHPTARALALDTSAQDLLFREARTANTFLDEPVSEEQVQAIYDLVKWGPTSMNMQPLRLRLVRSADAKRRLLKHMADGNRDKTEAAPLVAIVAADTDFHETMPKVFPHVPGAKDFFPEAEARAGTASFNATLQLGYLILGIRAAGLAAGPMTGFDAEGLEEDFFPDGHHRVLAVVNIGQPAEDAWFGRSPRLDYDEVVRSV